MPLRLHQSIRRPVFWALVITLFLFIQSIAQAAQVTIAWDPNDPAPDGYRVFQRVEGQSYDYLTPVWPQAGDDPTQTRCTITNLADDTSYYFVTRAYLGSDESSDSNEINFVTAPAIIIDDGESGTSSTGNWSVSGGTNPFGEQSLYSRQIGVDYVFQSQLTGSYKVAMWWSGYQSRCSNVPVEIYDGNELIDTINVDQSRNSGQWNLLGSYNFNGDAGVTIISDSRACSTCADAIRFVVDDEPKVVDDGDTGTSSNGNWNISGGTDPFGTKSLYSRQVGAEYTYASQVSGFHEVALWWSGWSSRCSDVPVEIYDGNMLLGRVYVDQSQNSGQWNLLGSYAFSGDARVTIISGSRACSTCADALKFSR